MAKPEPVHKQEPQAIPTGVRFRTLGKPGLNRWGGQINEEYLTRLQGLRGIRTFTEMGHDPVVGAMLFAFTMLSRQVPWRIEPFSEEPDDVERAEMLHGFLFEDMERSWQEVLSDIFTFLKFGWAYLEVVYVRRKDGRIGWSKWEIRSQESFQEWDLADDGTILGMTQQPFEGGGSLHIPMGKSLLFRTTAAKNNPEGESVLRPAYRPWYFKKKLEESEGIGIERELTGFPIVWVPPDLLQGDASNEKKQALENYKRIARDIRVDEQQGLVMPQSYDEKGHKLYDLTLLSTGGRRQIDISGTIERKNREIAMTMLADFILLGHEAVGSFALSDSKTHTFSVALGGILHIICDTVNRTEIPRILAYNGWPTDRRPRLVHGDIETPDLEALSNYVSRLAGAGIDFTDDAADRFFRDSARIPQRVEPKEDLGGGEE